MGHGWGCNRGDFSDEWALHGANTEDVQKAVGVGLHTLRGLGFRSSGMRGGQTNAAGRPLLVLLHRVRPLSVISR